MLNLDGYDLIMLSMVNKSIRSQTQDNLLWRKICFREFPNDILRMNYERKDISLNNNNWFNLWKEIEKKNSTIIFAEQPQFSLMIPPCWTKNERPYEIENLSNKGWLKFKVPTKIFVQENSNVKTELRRYNNLEENEISLWIKSMELYSVQLVRCC
ncbi:5237_t:CDS:2 [Dentiscutata erythropus]|uniref:5237_t:CDS:1 n=1 Tax=Dentiscutata erythropus TaxID=1348616 RepID=A0A9N8WP00_9GLOM|nr:5237_t:CDS:2 [Dentiscutata erythropus]